VKIGIDVEVYPQSISVAEVARRVEDAGLESLFFVERTHLTVSRRGVLQVPGHGRDNEMFDSFVALGAAAAVTSRLKIGTGACYVPVYDPIILARQVATVDQMCEGRFLFGVTPAWDEAMIRNHGIEPSRRWQVMREKVLAMKVLWTQNEAEFHGRFVNFDPVLVGLKPVQLPHPPILVGCHGESGLRRVVEYGDEWFPIYDSVASLSDEVTQLARLCEGAGREAVPVTVFMWTPDVDALERCAEAGVSRCVIGHLLTDVDSLDSFLHHCTSLVDRFQRRS
jgi:probable F420-dependent oxidoreductase